MSKNRVTFENAKLLFQNFGGRESMYNRAGDRNFNVLLDKATAEAMLEDGWNVKYLKSRDDGAEPEAVLAVSISYKAKPPNVYLIAGDTRTRIGEDEIEILDWVDISNIDFIVSPYEWEVNGKTGIKAYLHSMFVTLDETDLDRKYSEIPVTS